jgi:hypothetical protein
VKVFDACHGKEFLFVAPLRRCVKPSFQLFEKIEYCRQNKKLFSLATTQRRYVKSELLSVNPFKMEYFHSLFTPPTHNHE